METPALPPPDLPFAEEEVEGSLPARFARVAGVYAGKPAACQAGTALSYGQLNDASDQIANVLLEQGGPDAEPVALLLGHELATIAAILGVVKSGKFYVALDPAAPRSRQREIIQDAGARLLVTGRRHESAAADLAPAGCRILYADEIGPGGSAAEFPRTISPAAPMGLFYTSGSTGKPKGIEVSHRYVLRYAWSVRHSGHISAADRQALLFSSGFAAGLGVIFSTLLNGATLHLFDIHQHTARQLVEWLERDEISFLYPPVSLFREMVDTLGPGANLPSLRLIYLAGQTVHRRDVDRFQETFAPDCTLLLGFSSTEAAAITEFPIQRHTPLSATVIPVGFPVAGVEVRLYDDAGRPVGPRRVGEIAVRSRYMATGYWQEPVLTETKFRPDPDGGDRRIFLTGDLGRFNRDGSLELAGRTDFQVKIRGYRIEVGEIEAALFGLDCVKQAVVVDRETDGGEKYLAAYLIPASAAVPTHEELRRMLAKTLPGYMIPSAFVIVDRFPLTPTGKVHRAALPPPPAVRAESAAGPRPAGDPVERQLIRIWENVLGVHPIGVEDNFFDLGGHSLLALRLFSRIQNRFGTSLSVDTVFQLPTIKQMANYLRDTAGVRPLPALTPIQPRGGKPPLFCVHADLGTTYFYRRLTFHLGNDQPLFGLQARGLPAIPPPVTIEKMAAAYVREILANYSAGPVFIAGYSFGGKIALEMARRLRAEGRDVGLLALIDTLFARPPLSVRVRSFVRQFLALPGSERLRLLQGKMRGSMAGLARPVRRRLPPAGRKRTPSQASATHANSRQPDIRRTHRIATRHYHPGPYDGPVTYILARDRYSPAYHQAQFQVGGWARGPVHVIEIPCDHRGIIEEPGVQGLAEKLGECIDRALQDRVLQDRAIQERTVQDSAALQDDCSAR